MRAETVPQLKAADVPRPTSPVASRPSSGVSHRGRRHGFALTTVAVVVTVAMVATVAGGTGELVNQGGWPLMRQFWAAALTPAADSTFLAVTVRATVTTLAYAVLGTAGSIVLGLAGAVALSERWWAREAVGETPTRHRFGWLVTRGLWAVPRGIHEAIWGLVLISLLGRDPLVAILAIAIPFGAITAKVFAELVDDQHAAPYETLRAEGAGRITSLAYGVVPAVGRDLVSYGFYRFECSIRSSVVLGIVGAGGLGFELVLSFQSLRYEQMWTLIYALVLLSALGDGWSVMLRRDPSPRRIRLSLLAAATMVVGFVVHLGVDPRTLWSARTQELASGFVERVWPPHLPPGGWGQLVTDAAATLHMSITASVLASGLAAVVAMMAARAGGGPARALAGSTARGVLLFCRAIPPPVWALVLLFILFPGSLPGAVALGLYNFGILGRLLAEVVENHDPRPATALRSLGATPTATFVYGAVPQVAPRFAAYSLYRWEVTMRETVIVGLVGAGGLGRLLAQQNAVFDHAGMFTTVTALVLLTLVVDLLSARLRGRLR